MSTRANITIDQGSTFSLVLDLGYDTTTIVDLEGWHGRGKIRKSYGSSVGEDFRVEILDIVSGEIQIELSSVQTASLKPGRYVYDVEIFSDGSPPVVHRLIEGIAEVSASVTQANPTGEGIG